MYEIACLECWINSNTSSFHLLTFLIGLDTKKRGSGLVTSRFQHIVRFSELEHFQILTLWILLDEHHNHQYLQVLFLIGYLVSIVRVSTF